MRIGKLIRTGALLSAMAVPFALTGCSDDEGSTTPTVDGSTGNHDTATSSSDAPQGDTAATLSDSGVDSGATGSDAGSDAH